MYIMNENIWAISSELGEGKGKGVCIIAHTLPVGIIPLEPTTVDEALKSRALYLNLDCIQEQELEGQDLQ